MAFEFINPKTVDLTVQVDVDSDSNIAQSGATPAGTNKLTVQGFSISGTGANAETVFEKLLTDICGATYHMATTKRTLNQGVQEVS